MSAVTTQLLQSPLPALLQTLGEAIAEAQLAMDTRSASVAERLAEIEISVGESATASLLALGFMPSFYHLSSATLEARVAFSSTETTEFGVGASIGGVFKVFSAQVDASYSNKYSFNAEGSSSIVANFVSVPPPAALRELLVERAGRS